MSINPTNNCPAANLAVQMSTGHLSCAEEEPGCGTKVPGFHPPMPHASALDQGGLNALSSPPSHGGSSKSAGQGNDDGWCGTVPKQMPHWPPPPVPWAHSIHHLSSAERSTSESSTAPAASPASAPKALSNPLSNLLPELFGWLKGESGRMPTWLPGNNPITGDPPPQTGGPAVHSIPIISGTFNADFSDPRLTGISRSPQQSGQDQPIPEAGPIGDFGSPAEGAGGGVGGGGGGMDLIGDGATEKLV